MSHRSAELFAAALIWPARKPWIALAITLALCALAFLMVRKAQPTASLETMFDSSDPAARALSRVAQDFAAVDDLLLLVTAAPETSADEAAARLLAFAQRFDRAVKASPQATAMAEGVVYSAGAEVRRFLEQVVIPSGVYYLDDRGFAAFLDRLGPAQMRLQIEQNEAMLAAPGPGAGALARVLVQDPLRLRELLTDQLAGLKGNFNTYRGQDTFINPSGRALIIRVPGKSPAGDLAFARSFVAAIENVLAGVSHDGLTVEITGGYAIAAASERAVRADMISSVAGSVVLQFLFFLLMYRRLWSFGVALVPVAVGILLAFGLYAAIHPAITPLTAVLGGILGGMGIEYCIHYLSHYTARRAPGLEPLKALAIVAPPLAAAMAMACITTIAGFLAITWTGTPALRDFAIIGALGLALVFFATLFVLPPLVVLLDRFTGRYGELGQRLTLEPLVDGILRRRRSMVALSCLLAAAVLVGGFMRSSWEIQYETDLRVMHPRPNPPLDAQTHLAEQFDSMGSTLQVLIEADTADVLLASAHEVARRLGAAGPQAAGVSGVYGLSSLLPDPAGKPARAAAIAGIDVEQVIRDFRAAIADSAFAPEAYLPFEDFLRRLIAGSSSPPGPAALRDYPLLAGSALSRQTLAGVAGTLGTPGAPGAEAMTQVFFDRPLDTGPRRQVAIAAIRAALADLPGRSRATLTGISVVGHDAEQQVQSNLLVMFGLAAAVVLIQITLYLRRGVDVLLCVIPVAYALVMLLGYMGLAGERLSMINLVAAPMLTGMAVDHGIFLVSIDRQYRDSAAPGGLRTALAAATHAIFMTSATTALGFGSLVYTSMPAVQSLGRIMAVGMMASFVGAIFLLMPCLLLRRAAGSWSV